MMTVLEYANDINQTVDEVLKKCEELGIDVFTEDDILDQDAIIMLDNAFNIVGGEDNDTEFDDEADDFIRDEELIEEINRKYKYDQKRPATKTTSKRIKRSDDEDEEIEKTKIEKKRMYKSKEKLISNLEQVSAEIDKNTVVYKPMMTVNEFASVLNVKASDVIKKLMDLGVMATANNVIEEEQAEIIALEYDKNLAVQQDEVKFEEIKITDNPEDLEERPPVVTIMGHVDHGKTTLLDTIRKSNVTAEEAGGITQHIGAYQVEYNGKKLTFLDTPGHEAFTEMRARGARVTDIVVIVVAANDGVMPQTKEAIDHAKAADVPIIIAVNKMDLPGVNPEKVMQEVSELGLIPEEWGGDTIFVKVSALKGDGINDLLDNILLIADMLELKANPKRYAIGTVLEASLDKRRGTIATLLVENGTLRLGDPIVAGVSYGKVRSLTNDLGKEIVSAGPGTPIEIAGLDSVPNAGDKFMAFANEKKARQISEQRKKMFLSRQQKTKSVVTLEDLFDKIQEGQLKALNVVVKADVNGSVEVVRSALEKINVEGIKINIVRASVGAITESDIVLAQASDAIIIGFNVRPSAKTRDYAKERGVEIRLYDVIYKLTEEMEKAMKGMLDPEYEEQVLGQAEVRKLFKFSKVGTIAGCFVLDGLIKRDSKVRVIRDGVVVYTGELGSLQHGKDSIKEAKKGHECGLTITNYNDIKEGDIIEAYELVQVEHK